MVGFSTFALLQPIHAFRVIFKVHSRLPGLFERTFSNYITLGNPFFRRYLLI